MKEVDKKGCRNVTRMGRGRTELRLEQVILLIYDHAFFLLLITFISSLNVCAQMRRGAKRSLIMTTTTTMVLTMISMICALKYLKTAVNIRFS